MRMVLATSVLEDMELRHIDLEQVFLSANVDTVIYVKLLGGHTEL